MQNILLIGATSLIATKVAERYARRGCKLFLVGRDKEKLSALTNKIGSNTVGSYSIDLNNVEQIQDMLDAVNLVMPTIDIVLIAHGYLGDQLESERSFKHAHDIIQTNYVNCVGLIIPLVAKLRSQGSGKLGVLLSVAGDRGRPRNFTYGSAKGALGLYLQGLRSSLYQTEIEVHSFKLGPVDTPMTVDHEKNFSFSSPDRVADLIISGFNSSKRVHYVPSYWAFVMFAVRWMPEFLFQHLKFLSGR